MKKIIAVVMTMMTALLACGCMGRMGGMGTISYGNDRSDSSESSFVYVPEDTVVELDFGIEETVLVDRDDMKITAKNLAYDELYGMYLVDISVENKTDKNISVSAMEVGVNSLIVTCVFSMKVPAGETGEDALSISKNFVEAAGVENIMELEISLRVLETENYSTLLETEMVRIPTSLHGLYEQVIPEGVLLMEWEGVKIYGVTFAKDSKAESGVILYLVNDSDNKVVIACPEIAVNGKDVDGSLRQAVPAGYSCVKAVSVSKLNLEKVGITEPEKCSMTLEIWDEGGFHLLYQQEQVEFHFQ